MSIRVTYTGLLLGLLLATRTPGAVDVELRPVAMLADPSESVRGRGRNRYDMARTGPPRRTTYRKGPEAQ